MIHFGWLWVAWLLPLPLLVFFLAPRAEKRSQSQALMVPFADDIHRIGASQIVSPTKVLSSKWPLLVMTLLWMLLILATMRPQWLDDPVALPMKGRDLMLAVDLSGSMRMEDFSLQGKRVNRLTATKALAAAFIQRRTGDRIGLILFGDQAYIQSPLSFDRHTVNKLLMESALGLAGKMTAIGDAIGLAVKHLSADHGKDRVLILLTDGVNTAGKLSPKEAAGLAKNAGLRIYTIGIGADRMIQQGFFGATQINPSAELDEKMLTDIAEQSGGHYFRARSSKDMAQIYRDIDAIEPITRDKQFFRPIQALFFYPLGLALMIILCWITIALWHRKNHEFIWSKRS